jgi:hypothetical protein
MIQLLTVFSAQPITPADGYAPPLSAAVGRLTIITKQRSY